MKRLLLLGIALLIFITQVFSLTIVDTSIQSVTSNTTINFTRAVNTSLVTIGDDFVSLENFTFNESESFWENPTTYTNNISLFNYTVSDIEVFTDNFLHYFRFNNTITGSLISNYSFGNFTNPYTELTVFFTNFIIGNNVFTFDKLGYVTSDFNINFSTTSQLNTTYNLSPSIITVTIRDKVTGEIINGTNFTLDFIATVSTSTSTTTGLVNITNTFFQEEEYNLFVTGSGYEPENVYFDFTNKELLSISVYMIESNYTDFGYINLFCLDEFGRGINGATVQALQWDSISTSYIKVSEKKTDYTGSAPLNIILDDKTYRFSCIFNDQVGYIGDFNIPTEKNGASYYITLQDEADGLRDYLTNGISYTTSESNDNSTAYINFTWVNSGGTDLTGCINVYYYPSNTTFTPQLVSSTCSTSSSASITKTYNISGITNIYVIRAELNISGSIITVNSWTYYPDNHISEILKNYSFYKYILPFITIFCIVLMFSGTFLENKDNNSFEYVGLILLCLSYYLATILIPSLIDLETFIIITIMSIITMVSYSRGGNK